MTFLVQLLDWGGWLLWLSYRRIGADPTRPAGTLLGNLRPAVPLPRRSWMSLVSLVLLLGLRPLLLAVVGAALDATPTWSPGPIVIAFRADAWGRLYLFSTVSFCWTGLTAFAVLLAFSWLCRGDPEMHPFGDFIVALIGPIARFPWPILVALPWLLGAGLWFGVGHLLAQEHLLPSVHSSITWLSESAIMGSAVWMPLRWALFFILVLQFLHNYVYLGEHPLWEFVQLMGRRLQKPFRWIPLEIGQMDLAPMVAGAIYLALGEVIQRLLSWLFARAMA